MRNNDIARWLTETFQEENIPRWPCPFCWDNHLGIKNLKVNVNEAVDDPEDSIHPFIGELVCSSCNNSFSITGEAIAIWENYSTQDGYSGKYVTEYCPKYFVPNLRMFYLEDYFPETMKEILNRAFALFFSDIHASASMIRVAIEKLLDLEKFGKIKRKSTKGKYRSLHERIEEVQNPEVKNSFEAIKWIGNYGAHLDEKKLTRKNLLAAFDIMHFILEENYSTRERNIKRKVAKINKRHKKKPKP